MSNKRTEETNYNFKESIREVLVPAAFADQLLIKGEETMLLVTLTTPLLVVFALLYFKNKYYSLLN